MKPAQKVIKEFGGVRATARILQIYPSSVSRWVRVLNGRVPSKHQAVILKAAKDRGLNITAEDLILP